jgi:hypothetical protein
MGGWGSGRSIRLGTRPTESGFHRLAINALTRGGWLRPGTTGISRWFRGDLETGSISWSVSGVDGEADAVTLFYRCRGEDIRERIDLTWTACHFGGKRPWFVCRGCGRRCGVLYGGVWFRCRHCYGLAYESTREKPHERTLRRVQAIRRRLGGSPNLLEPFPPKPPRMHWKTYWRLLEQADAAEAVHHVELVRWLDRLQRGGDADRC